MPSPLALSDVQLDTLFRLAAPLQEHARAPFLRDVAEALVALPELGDGNVAMVAIQMQRRYWQPPDLGRMNGLPKHARR